MKRFIILLCLMSNDNCDLYKIDWKLCFSARLVCQGMCHVTYNWRANRHIHKALGLIMGSKVNTSGDNPNTMRSLIIMHI